MQYTLDGTLCGYICAGIDEPVANATIELYEPADAVLEQDLREIVSTTKKTFTRADEQFIENRTKRKLGETETDEDGTISPLTLSEKQDEYSGGPISIFLTVRSVPGRYNEDAAPVTFYVTTLQPGWKGDIEKRYTWEECLSRKLWCWVRSQFDAWVVCGQVTVCGADTPVPDLTVAAFDADITQDDPLGSAVTDSNGRYRIYYSESDFEPTPIPGLDIELVHGPDLFFRVSTSTGEVLTDEDRSKGRTGERENADHCERVDLCVDVEDRDDPKEWGRVTPTLWDAVGSAFLVPNDFDNGGYGEVGATKYALTGNVQFTGSAPVYGPGGGAVEYRFRVSSSTRSNGSPAFPASHFTRSIGDQNNSDLFAPSTLGRILVFVPSTGDVRRVVVQSAEADLDNDGYLNVEDAIDRELQDELGVGLSQVNPIAWNDTDQLMGLNTQALAPDDPDPSPANVGDPVQASNKFPVRKVAVRFETRNAGSLPVGGGGTTLNAMVIDNNPAYKDLLFKPFQTGDPCEPVSGTVELAYNVYHPHLGRAWITLTKNTRSRHWRRSIDDDAAASDKVPVDIDVSGASDEVHNTTFDITPHLDGRCVYIVRLHERRRLHTGYRAVDTTHTEAKPFFYEP